jgi:hypothetical protein
VQLFASTRKGLFRFERDTSAWKITARHFLGDNVTLVQPLRDRSSVLAALDHGHFGVKLHRSLDAGASFEEIAAPRYPEPPPNAPPIVNPISKREIPCSLKLIWALAESADGSWWCGTIPGGLFRSRDRGESWAINDALWGHPARAEWFGGGMEFPGIHSITPHPSDAASLGVGVSCGGYWVTRDAGESWENQSDGMYAEYMPPEQRGNPNVQDVHCVVRCAAAPEVLWAQHHNAVFRSADGAKSWSEISAIAPSKFGFTVAVDPNDPATAWFVPAVRDEKRIPVDGKLAVARTRDAGRSFELLRNGLPQQDAYDLVYRHALDVDPSGRTLALGSTTGSLWISEDAGDHFSEISSHLPEIYSVRFGLAA